MPDPRDQEGQMKWILFFVFVGLFVLIVMGTLAALFFGFGTLQPSERETLFKVFLIEIGLAVVALFYSIFRIKGRDRSEQAKVRLSLGELGDVRRLVGKAATISPSKADGSTLEEDIKCRILDDNGPYVPLDLPPLARSVYLTVQLGDKSYSGSFAIGTHLVELNED